MDARRFSPRQGRRVEKSRWRSGPASRSGVGAEAGCVSFGYLFFAQAKKSNSLPEGERKPWLQLLLPKPKPKPVPMPVPVPVQSFRPPSARERTLTSHSAVERLFFACAKKGGPKKAHPAYAPSARCAPGPLRCRDFSTIHPCIVEKRRASCTSPRAGSCPSAPSLRKGPGRAKAEATAKTTAKAKATPPQPSPCLRQREGARATATAAAASAGLVPQAEDQPEQHELYGVVTTINRPQLSAALGKLVVDAEAGRDHAETGHQAA